MGLQLQSCDSDEPRQYANTAAVLGRRSGKSGKRFNKQGSRDESGGEHTHHFAHIALTNIFSGFNRERKKNIEFDGGEMPNYMYPGSEFSEYRDDQSYDKTKDHETTEESLQESPSVDNESTKDQSLVMSSCSGNPIQTKRFTVMGVFL